MKLLNFFRKQYDLVAKIDKLETTIKHKNRTIGGYQGAYTRFINKLKPCCKDCEHLAESLED
jgi:hypothetical protein